MASWRNSALITVCPECERAQIKLARAGGRTPKSERVYHCPKCKAVFTHDEIVKHWPRKNQRPKLEVVVSYAGYLKVRPIGDVSETV